ncbi:PAS domain-containing protein [Mucilaginibacter endophyticus]|uniref:PAS domain-containing protein n=1 Tax=Mucilaginibacter endophyticus TaxID=2675003 RepID=UPI000E0CF0C1|nr:PAS domain-containing protein [Mucilaginibacter endophyticus]
MDHLEQPELSPAALYIYETLPICCILLSPDFRVITASTEYLELIGKDLHAVRGKNLFELFDQLSEVQEAIVRASLSQALTTKKTHTVPLLRYDFETGNVGEAAENYWQLTNKPFLSVKKEIIYLLQVLQQAPGPEAVLRRTEQLKNEMDMLFHAVPAQIAIVSGPDLTFSYINPRYQSELFPNRNVLGMPLLAALPEISGKPVWDIVNKVYRTGEQFAQNEMHVVLADEVGGQLIDHYFNVVYQALHDSNGQIYAVLSFKYEVTELVMARKLAEQRGQELQSGHQRLNEAIELQRLSSVELASSNEELAATNEELTSINEELKQAQDELSLINGQLEERVIQRTKELTKSEGEQQALNEELTAINEELSSANEELIYSKDDLEKTIKELAVMEQKMRSLVQSAPFPIGVYTGREMRVEMVNQSLIDVWGKGPDVVGKTYSEALPELAETGIYEQLDQVYTTGIAFHAVQQRVDLVVDGVLQPFYFNYDFTPLFDKSGEVYGVMNTAADVTGLMNAKMEVENSQKNLFNIIMKSPVAKCILFGADYRIDVANDRMIEIWGKNRAAVMNMPLFRALPEATGQGLEELLESVFEYSETIEARERLVLLERNGEIENVYIDFVYQPYTDVSANTIGIIITAVDVTAQVSARFSVQQLNEELAATNEELTAANEEQAKVNYELAKLNDNLKISQNELQLAIDAAALGTWDLNPQTGHFSANAMTKAWFGLQPDEDIALSVATSSIAEEDRQRVMEEISRAMDQTSGGNYDVEYTIIHPLDGTKKAVRAKGKAFFNELKEPIRFSGILLDITEQKKDEQRKNDFIGIVSHELKTPLTSLKALLQVSSRKLEFSQDKFLKGALETSNLQIRKMENMINGFLNISRLENGKLEIRKSIFDLVNVITEVIYETKLTVTGHEFILQAEGELMIDADREKISSVVSNFLSNAVKYSSRGSSIEISAFQSENNIIVSVRDYGIGISDADKERLFERYYRVESNRTSHISGFGIGLYLSAEIIGRHEGRIWVESEEGKGSTFSFALPL